MDIDFLFMVIVLPLMDELFYPIMDTELPIHRLSVIHGCGILLLLINNTNKFYLKRYTVMSISFIPNKQAMYRQSLVNSLTRM